MTELLWKSRPIHLYSLHYYQNGILSFQVKLRIKNWSSIKEMIMINEKVFVILLFVVTAGISQNLVPNPGFDDLTDCPFENDQISFARFWQSASNGSPDLFNSCSAHDGIRAPFAGHSLDSYQLPRSGSGYAYLLVYNEVNYDEGNTGNSEYIETSLTESMQAGKYYFIEFYVSPDFNSTFHYGYSDAIGLALTDTFYSERIDARKAMSLDPVIEHRGKVVKDTSGWTRISGCYRAVGGERFAIIGNFRSTEETMVEFEEFTFPFINFFYVDDVLIRPFDPLPDTLLLCAGLPITVHAGFLDATYRWNTGATDSILAITRPGRYSVEAFIGECILYDTVLVLDTRNQNFFTDTILCQNESLQINSPWPGKISWSDGHSENEYHVSVPGTYQLLVSNSCGDFVFTTHVGVEDCSCRVYVPSVFSPNADGVNDQLEFFLGCDYDYQVRQFTIYDRWGSLVFQRTGLDETRWDGNYQGKPLPPDVYVWMLDYVVMRNGSADHRIDRGDVTILR